MPPHDPGTGRGATVRAVLYFLASTPFLVILALVLHFTGVLTLDRVTDLLHGRKAPPEVARGEPSPPTKPGVEPRTPRMDAGPGPDAPKPRPPAPVIPGATDPRSSPPPPPANRPPVVAVTPKLVFEKGERAKAVEVTIADEDPSAVKVVVTSQNESLVPPAGLRRDGAVLTVIPAPGRWGEAVVRVTATDAAGLPAEAVVRVTVPAPEFALGKLADVKVKRNEVVPPVALAVVDESPVPGKVTFAALAGGAVLPADGVKVTGDRLELAPAPKASGTATVTVIATAADGRTARGSFRLTVEQLGLVVGGKARVTGTADLIPTTAEAVGGGNLGVPDLERGTEVRVLDVRGARVRVAWGDHVGWTDATNLTATE